MDTCPVVKVKADNEDGYMLINESDFDKDVHVIFEEAEEAEEVKKTKKSK